VYEKLTIQKYFIDEDNLMKKDIGKGSLQIKLLICGGFSNRCLEGFHISVITRTRSCFLVFAPVHSGKGVPRGSLDPMENLPVARLNENVEKLSILGVMLRLKNSVLFVHDSDR
jgi:hypothetical protein